MSRFSRSKRAQLILIAVGALALVVSKVSSVGLLKWIAFGATGALWLAAVLLSLRSPRGSTIPSTPSARLEVAHRPAQRQLSAPPKKKYAANMKAEDGRWTGGRIRLDRDEFEFGPTILEQVWAREGWTTSWQDISEVGVCECMPKLIGRGLLECMYLTTTRGDYQLFRVFDPQRVALDVRSRAEANGGVLS